VAAAFGTNCYVVATGAECLVVDPGIGATDLDLLAEHRLRPSSSRTVT
jgi:glyoxylase-like metal-dependent hydrolase (beta-lactamase superfamily II)